MLQIIFQFLIATQITYAADPSPDLYCKPANAWDRGYDLEVSKCSDGTYTGQLSKLVIYGRTVRYKGLVRFEVLSPAPNCVLKLSGHSLSGTAFELELPAQGDARLVRVNGHAVEDVEQTMECQLSPEFADVADGICNGILKLHVPAAGG